MEKKYQICVCFSGITVRFLLPAGTKLPVALSMLCCPDPETVDEEYEVCLLCGPLTPLGAPIHEQAGILFYPMDGGILRVFTMLTAPDGCQTACLLRPDGKNKLYFPASQWDRFRDPFNCLHLLGGEALLIKYGAFLLHSSVVRYHGKAILFSGPSGAGKSTQAELWARYMGAELINGDRCVVMECPDGFYGGGSPWSGTSGIYRSERSPIAGILLVHQAEHNAIERLGYQSFQPLFSQTIVNSWDTAFMEKLTDIFVRLLSQVPIYKLYCRPDEDAVRLVHDQLF